MSSNLNRFIIAQANTFQHAVDELTAGHKETHWMWFIFPQFSGLGRSEMAKRYELQSGEEAVLFLQHEVLGERLLYLVNILVEQNKKKSAHSIFGFPDYLKFQSCLTLFEETVAGNSDLFPGEDYHVFSKALKKYFGGKKDHRTLQLLKESM